MPTGPLAGVLPGASTASSNGQYAGWFSGCLNNGYASWPPETGIYPRAAKQSQMQQAALWGSLSDYYNTMGGNGAVYAPGAPPLAYLTSVIQVAQDDSVFGGPASGVTVAGTSDCSLPFLKSLSASVSAWCPQTGPAGCQFVNTSNDYMYSQIDSGGVLVSNCQLCVRVQWDTTFLRGCCLGSITDKRQDYCDPAWWTGDPAGECAPVFEQECAARQCTRDDGRLGSCLLDPNDPCGKWYAGVAGKAATQLSPEQLLKYGAVDSTIGKYCSNFPDSPDCQCLRSYNACPDYRGAASCTFYTPRGEIVKLVQAGGLQANLMDYVCSACTPDQLVPSDMAFQLLSCPAELCYQVMGLSSISVLESQATAIEIGAQTQQCGGSVAPTADPVVIVWDFAQPETAIFLPQFAGAPQSEFVLGFFAAQPWSYAVSAPAVPGVTLAGAASGTLQAFQQGAVELLLDPAALPTGTTQVPITVTQTGTQALSPARAQFALTLNTYPFAPPAPPPPLPPVAPTNVLVETVQQPPAWVATFFIACLALAGLLLVVSIARSLAARARYSKLDKQMLANYVQQ